MAKCLVLMGELSEAAVALGKSCEFEPTNKVNKSDQRALNDLKITEKMQKRYMVEEKWSQAVTSITNLLVHCICSVDHICLKIECLLKDYKFEEAAKYSSDIMKRSEFANQPRLMCWRGKVLIYTGADVVGKNFLQRAMGYDPDLKECLTVIKMLKKVNALKEEATTVFKAGNYEEAIEKFRACLAVDEFNASMNSTLLLNIGICYKKLSQTDEAMKSFNQAIKYKPNYAKAYIQRGDLLIQLEEYNEAINSYHTASEYDSCGFNVQAKLTDAKDRAKKAKRKPSTLSTLTKILGIGKGSGKSQIKKGYKNMALKWHPDKNSHSPEALAKAEKIFRDVNEETFEDMMASILQVPAEDKNVVQV